MKGFLLISNFFEQLWLVLVNRFAKIFYYVFILLLSSLNTVNAGTFTVFGPESFTREAGKPETVTRNFTVFNPNTTYSLKLNNSLVSSAIVLVNATEITWAK